MFSNEDASVSDAEVPDVTLLDARGSGGTDTKSGCSCSTRGPDHGGGIAMGSLILAMAYTLRKIFLRA
jgi:MYXO-CTERM domain-containing protein